MIVTNNHVIDDGKKITVKLPDGRSFDAKLIGTDPATDIALLKIKSDKPLPTVEFGDDRQLRVGDWVVAVGNPFGLSNSVTAGIVSSIGRDIGAGNYNDFIQIDAPINRGNSGGPTFDLRGQVIGMNSMIFSPSGGSVGIGFAIPATTIHDVVAQLQAHGQVARGWLGVEIQSVTPEIASSLGLKDAKGAIVANVVPGGPAAKAGFEQGDIVTAIDGKAVEDNRDLTRKVALRRRRRQTATFTVKRQGKPKTIKVDDRRASGRQGRVQRAGHAQRDAAATGQRHGPGPGLADAGSAQDLQSRRSRRRRGDHQGRSRQRRRRQGPAARRCGAEDRQPASCRRRSDVQSGVAEAQKGGRKSVLLLVARSRAASRFVAVDIGTYMIAYRAAGR